MPLLLAPSMETPSELGPELVPGQRRLWVEMLAGRQEGTQLPPPNTHPVTGKSASPRQPPRGSVGVKVTPC